MTAALIFAASFGFVFALGIQQMNVQLRGKIAAFVTGLLIQLTQLVVLKSLPGPTDPFEIAAFMLGGPCGIVTSIWIHPHLVAMFSASGYAGMAKRYSDTKYKSVRSPSDEHAKRLGERLRLATELADDVARSDIESYCAIEHADKHDWYDTHHSDPATDSDAVAKAVRYLDLRNRVTHHPQQPHLVRFER
jgi:hypothetical protein